MSPLCLLLQLRIEQQCEALEAQVSLLYKKTQLLQQRALWRPFGLFFENLRSYQLQQEETILKKAEASAQKAAELKVRLFRCTPAAAIAAAAIAAAAAARAAAVAAARAAAVAAARAAAAVGTARAAATAAARAAAAVRTARAAAAATARAAAAPTTAASAAARAAAAAAAAHTCSGNSYCS